MTSPIDEAFLLTAGMGTRLKPYTDHCPKPLVRIAGRPLLDYTLDHLLAANVQKIFLNLHYRADDLRAWINTHADKQLVALYEEKLLDTGGGVKKALPLLSGKPFFIINGDALWSDAPNLPTLDLLAQAFDPDRMDILLLLHDRTKDAIQLHQGDYDLRPDGRAVRTRDKSGRYIFAGVRIANPAIFHDQNHTDIFSFLELMDTAERGQRLYGMAHAGEWHHISTSADLERVDALFRDKEVAPPPF